MRTSFTLYFFTLLLAGASVCAQQYPLNEKSRYEAEVENKVNEHILKILGPNKAKVMVQADMDFSMTERIKMEGGAAPDQSNFKWSGMGADAKKTGPQLLPGFPVPGAQGGTPSEGQSYDKQLIYPPSLVKKLTVSLVVNKDLQAAEVQEIQAFVSDIMNLNPRRGDEVILVRAPFASLWRTIWFMPEAVNIIFRYGIISVAIVVAMLALMVGILKLSNSMKQLGDDRHQISMDFGSGEAGAGAREGEDAVAKALPGPGEGAAGGEAAQAVMEEIYFNVKAHQVPVLIHMMAKESPVNIALIAAHIEPQLRTALLKGLPPQVSSAVIASMAEIRFVKPEMIEAIKEELERRFSGAVGGIEKVFEVMDNVGGRVRKEMLLELERSHPEVASKVRAKILLFDDLELFSDEELSVLVHSVKVDEWAGALSAASEAFGARVRGHMPERMRQMLEQTIKYGAIPQEKIEAASEAVLAAAQKLIKEGRARNPLALKAPAPEIQTV